MSTIQHVSYVNKFSTSIEGFERIAMNENLSKTDLRLFCFLCTRLESRHCSKIDIEQIAESLNITKNKVKESLENLVHECIITPDSDNHVKKNGYRFTYTEDFDLDDDDRSFT